ncbi:winged helix-turn-helix domain-containing protein [Pseudomonas sp. MS19]|uniref:ATP-binding protein n=1 Tax=Pseudomonas sp. MS19 TaxID=2579939 RepID=UPI0015626D7C|nr:winged helix-turn-helix domain-containing protein [Pseudomonas sp. MS19]
MEGVLRFSSFSFHVHKRIIFKGDCPLRIGSKALDILHLLLEHAGDIVSKESIIAHVWPSTVVEESNMRVHIAALRRALGDGVNGQRFIINVPQRGYSFVAQVEASADGQAVTELFQSPPLKLPARLFQIRGRDAIIDRMVRLMPGRRLTTVVGAGGIGKTTVAVRAAELLQDYYTDGVIFVDLAEIDDPALVCVQVSLALGLSSEQPEPLCRFLADRHLLLLMDNCEHVIDACAELVETLLKSAPRLSVLATSREPLLVSLECVQRLPALNIPGSALYLSCDSALGYSAVQLFVSRLVAHQEGCRLRDCDVPVVVDICRRLEGIPLAIELAASYVNVFGLKGLLAQLDSCFWLSMQGARTALPRHHSLRASLEWSYRLLTPIEQIIFQRFATFEEAVTLEQAIALIGCKSVTEADIFDAVVQLAAKSLLAIEMGKEVVHYRLLNFTRVYALEKLSESADFRINNKRYAHRQPSHAAKKYAL